MSLSVIIIFIIAAFIIGLLSSFILAGKSKRKVIALEQKLAANDNELQSKNVLLKDLQAEMQRLRDALSTEKANVAAADVNNKNLQEKLENQKKEIEELQKRLTLEFENIANRVLKQRADEFSQTSEKNLGVILNPLGDKIKDFKDQVEKAFNLETRDKISLKEEVKKLTEMNSRMSEEANNLTKALKGDVKKQGNWGEIILERVLESSGLQKGIEYQREVVVEGMNGETYRPDVIVKLPDDKHILVDSKVSLTAYDKMMSADEKTVYDRALKEHIDSLKSHVRELAEKHYQNAKNLNTPDFVLMFLPIEASFSVAVQADPELFSYAWERKIVIVSPTTLLATLRTVASIWKQENQTKNAQEIARLSGALYDKLVGFTEDWQKVKDNLDRAGKSYDEALRKMNSGQGNVFRTAEKIKQLGAKTNKNLPSDLNLD